MILTLIRTYKLPTYTIGKLYIDGQYFSDTLEDTDRGLYYKMPITDIKKIKIPNETAIPTGTYKINMNTVSPKFGAMSFYKEVCGGKLPRLMDVPGFEGILIHCGSGPNGHLLTSGCLLCGKNTIKGGLTESKETFVKLYEILKEAKEDIYITIL